jgi:hypothetical protein
MLNEDDGAPFLCGGEGLKGKRAKMIVYLNGISRVLGMSDLADCQVCQEKKDQFH